VPGVVLALACLAAAGLLLEPPARADVVAARVVDRTFLCSTSRAVRSVDVSARSGVRSSSAQWKDLPSAWIDSGLFGADARLVTISAGTMGEFDRGGIVIHRGRCARAAARVALSTRGLSGDSASQLGKTYDCRAPTRILVRIRMIFRSPTSLKTRRFGYAAFGAAKAGYLAVRTEAGKPLAYADVVDSGRARLFTARSCVPD
jgi:hypothetical protein